MFKGGNNLLWDNFLNEDFKYQKELREAKRVYEQKSK